MVQEIPHLFTGAGRRRRGHPLPLHFRRVRVLRLHWHISDCRATAGRQHRRGGAGVEIQLDGAGCHRHRRGVSRAIRHRRVWRWGAGGAERGRRRRGHGLRPDCRHRRPRPVDGPELALVHASGACGVAGFVWRLVRLRRGPAGRGGSPGDSDGHLLDFRRRHHTLSHLVAARAARI